MAGNGVEVDETIVVAGASPGSLAQGLLQTVSATGRYQVERRGDFRYQLRRRARPLWASVLGWVGTPLLIGIPLLFVRTTEVCDVIVLAQPATALRLTGRLSTPLAEALRALARPATAYQQCAPAAPAPVWPAGSSGAPAPTAPIPQQQAAGTGQRTAPLLLAPGQLIDAVPGGPVPTTAAAFRAPLASDVDGHTRRRAPHETIGRPSPEAGTPRRPLLVLQPGGRQLTVGRLSLLGRDPAAQGEAVDDLVVLDDAQISKTHLAFGADRDGVWVTDRHSTNGSAVLAADGTIRRCPPGQQVYLSHGDVVIVGSHRLTQMELA